MRKSRMNKSASFFLLNLVFQAQARKLTVNFTGHLEENVIDGVPKVWHLKMSALVNTTLGMNMPARGSLLLKRLNPIRRSMLKLPLSRSPPSPNALPQQLQASSTSNLMHQFVTQHRVMASSPDQQVPSWAGGVHNFTGGQIVQIFNVNNLPSGSVGQIIGWHKTLQRWVVRLGNSTVVCPATEKMRPASTFQATNDWQVVPEGAMVPQGLEVKLDMESGRAMVRLPQSAAASAHATGETDSQPTAADPKTDPPTQAFDNSLQSMLSAVTPERLIPYLTASMFAFNACLLVSICVQTFSSFHKTRSEKHALDLHECFMHN
eukprot:gnl/MRDRNA2_/MRDRNA2_166701_c0_seq1.p1 gnl/MRDRNA2_/MRDRNA2_166701_c0~~gnl/MRDRNA2_/MRDRNA2_166701_c0_seq1.p1  ORF type:complete len:358 (+),score=48.00 gnl/MRDRNA2_/MRDRNA2_166701_c0_seq1:116-1075(+)